MNHFIVQIPTLSDVATSIRSHQPLSPERCDPMMSALRNLEGWSDRKLRRY